MSIAKKAAYIKGLAEGLGIDESTNEGKILKLLIEAVEDLAEEVEDLEREIDDTQDEVSALVDDVEMIAEDFYGDEFEDCCDDDCDCDCSDGCVCGDDDEPMYEVTCPQCEEKIFLDEDMLDDGEIQCPACGQEIEFDLPDEEE